MSMRKPRPTRARREQKYSQTRLQYGSSVTDAEAKQIENHAREITVRECCCCPNGVSTNNSNCMRWRRLNVGRRHGKPSAPQVTGRDTRG
jgi:hypothetical protein